MDTKEYINKVNDLRAELFRLAKMGRELIEGILAEKGDITEERLYDGSERWDRDWIWMDYKWDDAATDLCVLNIRKSNGRATVNLFDLNMDYSQILLLDHLPPSDIVEIANQLCIIYDRL